MRMGAPLRPEMAARRSDPIRRSARSLRHSSGLAIHDSKPDPMRVWRHWTLVLWCALGVFIGHSSYAQPVSSSTKTLGDVQVETTTSWLGVGRPEVHFLIKNHGSTDLPFSLVVASFGSLRGQNASCGEGVQLPSFALRGAMDRFDRYDEPGTIGILPSGGWAHRVVSLKTGRGPCSVPYILSLDSDVPGRIEGVVKVPSLPQGVKTAESVDPDSITSDYFVEIAPQGHLALRILLANEGNTSVTLHQSDKNLVCRGSGSMKWSVFRPVLQGLDSGTFTLGPGQWVVLTHSVQVIEPGDPGSCWAHVEFSYSTGELDAWPFRKLKSLELQLLPRGYVTRLLHGDDRDHLGRLLKKFRSKDQ